MIVDGKMVKRNKGMPQGGPLSPLLSNLLLDDLDKELEARGHHFCRYADDCNIYVRSQRAGERVLNSVRDYLSQYLKLSINHTKSGVDSVWNRKFLGFSLSRKGAIKCSSDSIKRLKWKVKKITRRNRGVKLDLLISELNIVIRGWGNYFKTSDCHSAMERLDGYIRRKLRCFRLKQIGHGFSLYRFLKKNKVNGFIAKTVAHSGKGWWFLSNTKAAHHAMNNKWFKDMGLLTLYQVLSR
jgi:retron-type reverse transcriptase